MPRCAVVIGFVSRLSRLRSLPLKGGGLGRGAGRSCAWEFEIEEPKPGCRNTTESPNESPPGGLPLVYDPIFLDGDVSNARPL